MSAERVRSAPTQPAFCLRWFPALTLHVLLTIGIEKCLEMINPVLTVRLNNKLFVSGTLLGYT